MNDVISPIKVLLADDHEIFRDGFSMMAKRQSEIELIGEASNGEQLIDMAGKLMPDVIVTDIKMPKIDGIEATKVIKSRFPTISIIALSMFDDDNLIIDMLEAGAKGYLLKSANKNEIIDAIKAVFKHEFYYCRSTSTKLIQLIAQSQFNPYKELQNPEFSQREIEIISLICQECTTKDIAQKLFLSIRTVEGYKEKIQEKMKVKNTAGIVVKAIKTGIYTP